MREIKFRGKRVDNGEWVYGLLVSIFVDPTPITGEKEIEVKTAIQANYLSYDKCRNHEVHPETVGQYTGLKDVVGNNIFEGDIVHSDDHQPPRYAIEYIEGGFCATQPTINDYPIDINHFYPSVGCAIKVIGNIHDNPELINT